jgi:hypothetical protein
MTKEYTSQVFLTNVLRLMRRVDSEMTKTILFLSCLFFSQRKRENQFSYFIRYLAPAHGTNLDG